VALEMTGLNRVVDYPVDDLTLTVEAGMTIGAIQALLAPNRQRLAIDAPMPDRATIGGVIATQFAGPRRLGWGRPRDQIIGVHFVAADGRAIKGGGQVVKNAAGYDFPRLLTGSMGTLGVITSVALKVRPMTEATAVAWIGIDDPAQVAERLDALAKSRVRPSAVELLNGPAARAVGGEGLSGGHAWVVAVGFEDNATSVQWQVRQLREEIGAEFEVVEGERAEAVWAALRDHPETAEGAIGLVANVRPSRVAEFVQGLEPRIGSVQAHAGNGIVRAWEGDAGPVAWLRKAAVAAGGNLVLSRAPVEVKKALNVWGQPRADWPLMERVRQAFDPDGILNPGRFLPRLGG
jgi:glycolate oxidase FAD binding subunit